MKKISQTACALKIETLGARGGWFPVMEGTAKKVVLHSHQDVAFLR
jgi:hypothetical protein